MSTARISRLFFLIAALALALGVFASCEDPLTPTPGPDIARPTPAATISMPAPGAYIPFPMVGGSLAWTGLTSTTSAQLSAKLTDEVGTGYFVLSNQAPLTEPVLNSPDIRGTISGPWTGSSITYLQENTRTSAQEALVITDTTGTGTFVRSNSPTLVTPILGIIQPGSTWNGASISWVYLQKDAAGVQIQNAILGAVEMSGAWTGSGSLPAHSLTGNLDVNSNQLLNVTGVQVNSIYSLFNSANNSIGLTLTTDADSSQVIKLSTRDATDANYITRFTVTHKTDTATSAFQNTNVVVNGPTLATGGLGVFALTNATTIPAIGQANTVQLFASAGKLWALDENGAATQLTP